MMRRGNCLALLVLCLCAAPSRAAPFLPVVVISIDGLKPDHVLGAERYRLKIPNLRRLLKEGAHATGVQGVFPTVTYPTHATLVTGVSPQRHGILANVPFDPTGKNMQGWYWYAEDLRVPALWDAAARVGLSTATVDWPVTVGANVTHNIVQYWRTATPDDRKIIRALSTKGLLNEAEGQLGPYPDGNDYTVPADRRRAAFVTYVLDKKRPHLLLCYFGGLDDTEHQVGPYHSRTLAALEELDALVGAVREAAEKLGGGRAVVAVVSDHGFVPAGKDVHMNAVLQEAGLIQLDDNKKVRSWQAFAWQTGGTAAIMLKEPGDGELRRRVRQLLLPLSRDPRNGIQKVLEGTELRRLHGFPGAELALILRDGYMTGNNLEGPLVLPSQNGGAHGYAPDNREMDAVFIVAGPGIPAAHSFGRIDARDVAPTLAGLLHVTLPVAEGRNLLEARR